MTFLSFLSEKSEHPEWGFFGHKRINRLAVFTLPQEMLPLFKKEIEFVTEHAVDPDKRRYATKHEAVRHYIDIDQWGTYPFENVPRNFTQALIHFSSVLLVTGNADTISASWIVKPDTAYLDTDSGRLGSINFKTFDSYFRNSVMPKYYDGPIFRADDLAKKLELKNVSAFFIKDNFSEHGILPYNLITYHRKLKSAFEARNFRRALRLATEMGHYIGDAHVPLHTTTNYNGQLTDQVGIHAFWESRIPELFADEYYDYFVGPAELIEDIPEFYWNMVLESHLLVDSVLQIEKRISQTFPADQQYCFEDRNFANVSQPCPAYAKAFSDAMQDMVEERFRASIHAIGSAWYSAWYAAGQPDLTSQDGNLNAWPDQDSTQNQGSRGKIFGRQHWD